MQTFFDHLRCTVCAGVFPDDLAHQACPECRKPLEARYDIRPGAVRPSAWEARGSYMWRYRDLLPIRNAQNVVTLGEGCTPLLRIESLEKKYHLRRVFIKDEGVNPTGSFKARGLSVVISKAKEMGVKDICLATAGNAGVAAAAYAAVAGIRAHVYMPVDTPKAFSKECEMHGAKVTFAGDTLDQSAMHMRQDPDCRNWYNVATFRQPYRVEGKKTMGFELWEQLDGELPDAIFYPAGGGTGIVALWKAFSELEELGLLKDGKKPRLVAVQAEGCAPIVKAFREKGAEAPRWENPSTLAIGIKVPATLGDYMVLRALYESEGFAVSVSEYEIRSGMREMASQAGVFCSPEGGAALSAVAMFQQAKKLPASASVVVFNTGHGARYTELL